MIRVEGLAFGYGRAPLYEKLELDLREPGIHGVFGRNGSGKSTLLKLLAGLLFPRRGRIDVLGRAPAQRAPEFLEQVYVVPEEFHLPDLSATRFSDSHAGFYPRFSKAAYADYMDTFEIDSQQRFGEMSLGQKKKAALAFALASFTPILLLDEPTNGLDIVGRDQFKRIAARPEQRQRMILISTHQAHDLERIMDRILFIDAGRLALSATLSELRSALDMGVAGSEEELAGIDNLLYREALGPQWLYVAGNESKSGHMDLELLYKALSREQGAILAALAQGKEAGHV